MVSPKLDDLLKPYAAQKMELHNVSPQVNNARNEGPELVNRVEVIPTTLFG